MVDQDTRVPARFPNYHAGLAGDKPRLRERRANGLLQWLARP